MTDLHWMTATEAARAIAARELSPVELMGGLLERIGRLDPKLNVFIRLDYNPAVDPCALPTK
jgi:aspartyl-tRNA(Asn)/glutamyl-tRNA(Gln) amidotransferase subunit A